MSDNEVEADIRADTVWQRPSWPLGQDRRSFAGGRARITDGFGFFSGQDPPPAQTKATAQQLALVVLDLEPPVTVAILKARYKQLVKRFHPDANGGDKVAEERFKEITAAYRTVLSSLT